MKKYIKYIISILLSLLIIIFFWFFTNPNIFGNKTQPNTFVQKSNIINNSGEDQIKNNNSPNSNDLKKFTELIGADFNKKLLSKLKKNYIKIDKSGIDIYLISFNEKVKMVTNDAGGGLVNGENSYNGDYFLAAVKNNKLISFFSVPTNRTIYPTSSSSSSDTFFCDNTPHNGIEKIIESKTGKELILIKMYGTSSTEMVYFFDYIDGNFRRIDFIGKTNADVIERENYLTVNYAGTILKQYKGLLGGCGYNNGLIWEFCNFYEFKDGDFYLSAEINYDHQGIFRLQ